MLDHLVQINDLEFLIPDLLVAAGETLRNHQLNSRVKVSLDSLGFGEHYLELGTALDFLGVGEVFILDQHLHLTVDGLDEFFQLIPEGFALTIVEEEFQLVEQGLELGLVI